METKKRLDMREDSKVNYSKSGSGIKDRFEKIQRGEKSEKGKMEGAQKADEKYRVHIKNLESDKSSLNNRQN